MTVEQILAQLRHPGTEIPREALAEVVRRPEEFIPALIAEIETATRLGIDADPDDNLASFALYLLAELREPRALEPILDYFALDGTTDEDLFGDLITVDGHSILAAVAHRQPERLQAYARRPDISVWVRSATFDALVTQVLQGEQPREPLVAYFTELVETNAFLGDADAWTFLINACLDLHPRDLLEPIRRLYERELVDTMLVGDFDAVEEMAAEDPEAHRQTSLAHHQSLTDTAEAISWWGIFGSPEPLDNDWEMDLPLSPFDIPGTPIRYDTPKIGRNDLCPCGSGKKYKKCCLPPG
ncbi:MAG: DUF1186 domain-containing protein [Chthoniobacter sp.]